MKKIGVLFLFSILFVFSVSAGSIDEEFQKLTHYAEEYEIGNINYPQLIVGIASARGKLSEMFGAVNMFEGGLLRQEEIEKILGSPSDMTRWVWVEGEDRDRKLDEAVPNWRKIIFDGRKVQIWLEVHPSIFSKKRFQDKDFGNEFIEDLDGEIVYRLHFNVEFKRQGESVDFEEEIERIGGLASEFSDNPTDSKAEELAGESVGVERKFEEFLRQNEGKCEDIIVSLLGSENQRDVQKIVVWEIDFIEGKDFYSLLRLEMCEECEWNWIGMDLRIENRNFQGKADSEKKDVHENFKRLSVEEIKREIKKLIVDMKVALKQEDFESAMGLAYRFRLLNDVWNEKANNVWEEIDEEFDFREELMSDEERQEWHDNYGWIKLDQERRRAEEKLRRKNFVERKEFYTKLFAQYDKRDYSFEEKRWEKRLFEDFVKVGREICDNNKDDNNNDEIDCADDMCGGSICGKMNGNVSVDLYCIDGECRAREMGEVREGVCGNHICEENEDIESCAEDCFVCVQHMAIECDGRIIFGGEDSTGCPLAPICMEDDFCEVDSDCEFLCGEGECFEGSCKVKELVECEEGCLEGEKNIAECGNGEKIILEICDRGIWKETGLECEAGEGEEIFPKNDSDEIEEEVYGDECEVISDCGGENDVCSNGKCVALPEKVEEEVVEEELFEEEEIEEEIEIKEEVIEEEPIEEEIEIEEGEDIPDNLALSFLNLFSKFKITGAVVGEDTSNEESVQEAEDEEIVEIIEEKPVEEPQEEMSDGEEERIMIEEDQRERDEEDERRREDEEDERREEDRRRETEMRERCELDCQRPCVEECIRENCGEMMDCDIDDERKECEDECEPESDCVDKCSEGGDWWKEFEKEHVIENGVFTVGGHCRILQGRGEGNIWFGGWGKDFEQVQWLKEKYYEEGYTDWCKYEFENALNRRKEFERGFDDDFAVWFFEKHLANSAEDWEQAQSGIYELYWNNVDNLMRMAHNLGCLEEDSLLDLIDYELINASYESEYGRLEFWEEIEEVRMPGMRGKIEMISPYMRIWIFPPKEFIKYEMKKSMENGEFPGPPEKKMERGNEEGLTSEEREKLRKNGKLMKIIRRVADKYGGSLDAAVQFKDGDEIIFNLYIEVSEEDILKMVPMLPEEVPAEDVRVEIDFNLVYDFILETEREMSGEEIESPPWVKRNNDFSVGGIIDGIKMYFKIRKIVNSAEYYPAEAKGDVKDLFWEFAKIMDDKDKSKEKRELEEAGDEEGEDKGITGKAVFDVEGMFNKQK
ncbi:hypothetical protein KAS08_05945 [Candidatus Pacearchaeota archaeon]|nr:hypothetical protein [Candidatus Pacearchaeota archaeon]